MQPRDELSCGLELNAPYTVPVLAEATAQTSAAVVAQSKDDECLGPTTACVREVGLGPGVVVAASLSGGSRGTHLSHAVALDAAVATSCLDWLVHRDTMLAAAAVV